jgi:hypothetical protein
MRSLPVNYYLDIIRLISLDGTQTKFSTLLIFNNL